MVGSGATVAAAAAGSDKGAWVPSTLTEAHLKQLETEGFIAAKLWRCAFGHCPPQPKNNERVMFGAFLERGLSLPASGFFSEYMVFACTDSRVCPTLTLGLQPGEAFTVRNVAGMVPAYQKTRHCSIGSAIEFAVVVLKVEYIVVIGHSRCAGIRELLSLKDEGPNAYHFIEDWVKIGMNAKKKVQRENTLLPFDDQCTVLEKEAVNVSLRNLQSYPFVKDRMNKCTLHLIGARYDFVHGSFKTWEP